ncbi:alpha/beta fold hydrolase [Marinomonas algicola]|uniref:alpha/beta fold hydrolase n=1 Tax=Marinomonas algicola TaxID=2773454 RepID=UPI0017494F35|nr:alpha/beta hydrolase [Marinomonas algicola]
MERFVKSIEIHNKQARYYDFATLMSESIDDSKPSAHFYGGNGFPAGVYEPLLTKLSTKLNLTSLAMRGYWFDQPNNKVLTREKDADMLIEFLIQTQSKPIIGIGHSQGASAMMLAAVRRPDLFSALFIIEPVTFTRIQASVYKLIKWIPRYFILNQEPFKSTLKKQSDWESTENYYQFLRQHRAYKRITDEHLRTFAKHSLVPKSISNEEGYTMLFPPKQELANYFSAPYITGALKRFNKINMPYTILLGKPSLFISDKVRSSWQGIVPTEQLTLFPNHGHLLPIETPEECANIILQRI